MAQLLIGGNYLKTKTRKGYELRNPHNVQIEAWRPDMALGKSYKHFDPVKECYKVFVGLLRKL